MMRFSITVAIVALFICLPSPPVRAQQTSQPSWQGTQPRLQPEGSSAQQSRPAPLSSQDLMLGFPQGPSGTYPQVIEISPSQPAPPAAPQSELAGEQEPGELGEQPEGANASQSGLLAQRPAYLGITYDTSPGCRSPAGVRVTGMFEGSPAQRAGLHAEGKLRWQQAIAGLLALSPAAPLAIPFILSLGEDSGPGDVILAADGERVRNKEEFEQAMHRFQPGDMVYLSVLRRSSLLQISVKLEEYPPQAASLAQTASEEASKAKGKKIYLY